MQQIQRPSMAMAGLLLNLLPPQPAPSTSTSQRRWSPRRRPTPIHRTTRIASSSSSRISATESSSATTTPATTTSTSPSAVKLTYLEFNGWLWELPGAGNAPFRILVDPILVGNLDFGIPWLFDAAKKTLKSQPDHGLLAGAGAGVDLLLITQSLDDHCHLRTLTKLAAIRPDLPVVTTPNARPILSALPFTDVTYLEPGQSTTAGEDVTVLATAGPVLGPPWQRPENGYIVTTAAGNTSVYYEPHCVYDAGFLRDRALRADVLITPVVKQLLPADFTLVSGQEDAVELARLLRPSYVVPMSNGEFDAKGLLATLVSTRGTIQAFRAMLADALPNAKVVEPTPGVPLHLCFDDDDDNNNNNNSSSSSSS